MTVVETFDEARESASRLRQPGGSDGGGHQLTLDKLEQAVEQQLRGDYSNRLGAIARYLLESLCLSDLSARTLGGYVDQLTDLDEAWFERVVSADKGISPELVTAALSAVDSET